MVDVELLLSDNGGVRIYPTEWHNTIYFGYQKNANIYRLHIGVLGGTSIQALER